MQIVYAKQPFPPSWTSAIFLAGPTPRAGGPASWRPDAIRLLREANYDGVVLVPEPEDGQWGAGEDAYEEQVAWERQGLDMADVILFWVPRNMTDMPGLTTNVEFGLYASSGKIVLGAPPEAASVRYLRETLARDAGSGSFDDLALLAAACVMKVASFGTLLDTRSGGERHVPLHVWTLLSFQAWYKAQVAAGNRLDEARVLWSFKTRPNRPVFSFVLWVKVWVAAERRHKDNEWVLSRSDISTVCMYHTPRQQMSMRMFDAFSALMQTEVVLVREFRSPARTTNGMIHELVGGSSFKGSEDPLTVGMNEAHEETGILIDPQRFRYVQSRQVAGTLSAHHAHLFAVELHPDEMLEAKTLANANITHGVADETERTNVEVFTMQEMLGRVDVDWANIGMIFTALTT